MNRRSFCKLTAGSVLTAVLMPGRMLGAIVPVRNCTVSVVRCECFGDLQSQFASDPEAGACPMLKPGMSWTVHSVNSSMPEGMCSKAWNIIRSHISQDGKTCSGGKECFVSCPDGIRPVIFKISYTNS